MISDKEVNENEFYSKSKSYWTTIEPTVDGMLGGFSICAPEDIKLSRKFLEQFFYPLDELKLLTDENKDFLNKQKRALDCGSGIGRITKDLLINFFPKVDLLDQNPNFLSESRKFIGEDIFDKSITTICSGLHEMKVDKNIKYDLIWCQWVTGYLTDTAFVEYLEKCKKMLNHPHGIVIIKDNHTPNEEVDIDMKDSSVTRSYQLIVKLIKQSNYKILSERKQNKFPKGIYPVRIFAISPEEWQ